MTEAPQSVFRMFFKDLLITQPKNSLEYSKQWLKCEQKHSITLIAVSLEVCAGFVNDVATIGEVFSIEGKNETSESPITTQRKDYDPYYFNRENEGDSATPVIVEYWKGLVFTVLFSSFFLHPQKSWMKNCVLRTCTGPVEWDKLLSGWINAEV